MKIKQLKVKKLQNRIDCDLKFNDDLNIVTGQNGSGKTTVLKLIWYLISGNIERVFRELVFEYLKLKTSNYDLEIKVESETILYKWKLKGKDQNIFEYKRKTERKLEHEDINIDFINMDLVKASEGSVFFPTFRRIEGGFTLTDADENYRYKRRPSNQIEEGLMRLSSQLSVFDNFFISSISTNDILELLRRKHSESSEEVNQLHIGMSTFIEKKIQSSQDKTTSKSKDAILDDIKKKVLSISTEREKLLSPFTTLASLISEIYQHKGILLTDKFSVGNTEEAISSAKLSAGEKQLLSFICYNAFSKESPFIIDEPELSLHVDWQRNLVPILMSQRTNNQIIIATHSPFIYSKYPEKELLLNDYRGE
ncbi:MAG: AAA family ATPase [Candidatus Paceibacterota bacterium]